MSPGRSNRYATVLRIEHLNDVLRAIRNVDQLILREKDPDTLAQEACRLLAEARQYHSVWLALWDADGRPRTAVEHGVGPDFEALVERLRSDEPPLCVTAALSSAGVHVVRNRMAQCGDCPLSHIHEQTAGMFVRLEHEGTIYGLLSISMPTDYVDDDVESGLVREIAGDIAYALQSIDQAARYQKNMQALWWERDFTSRLLDISPVAITVIDRQGAIVRANREAERTLGLTRDEIATRTYNDPDWRITDYAGNPFPEERLPARQVLEHGKAVYGVEHAIERLSGERVYLSVNAAPVWSGDGEISHVVCMVLDVTEQKIAEKALSQSEEEYRRLFEQSRDAVYLIAADGSITNANEAATELFGYTREELLSMNVQSLYADPSIRSEVSGEALERGGLKDFALAFRRKDGEIRECVVTATVLRNTEGDFAGFQTVIRDVTEQKRLEQALRESEEHYRTIFEQSLDALYVVDVDGRAIEANQRWLDMFGYTREELSSLRALDVYADPSDREDFLQRIDGDEYVEDDVLMKRKDGSVFTCHRTVTPRRDPAGAIVAFQGIMRDVTEQRRIGEALQDREQKYHSLFEQAREAISIVAPEGTILDANQAWLDLFGYERKELASLNVGDLYADPRQRNDFLRRMAEDGYVQDQLWYRKRDGTPVLCDRSVTAWRNEHGSTVAFQSFLRDITEERQLQQELQAHADHLRLLAQRVQAAREEERTGIARELHDRIGQEITALKLDVYRLKAGLQAEGSAHAGQVEDIEHLLDEAADDVRRISSELRPGVLDDIGLPGAIEWQVAELRRRTGISFG
ncbi:MAG: PAS domain S-box protein, partial [Chloroflexota bacterium]